MTEHELRVYLIGRPHFQPESFLEFMKDAETAWYRTSGATEPEEIVEVSGRVCYMSFGQNQSPRTNGEYIRNLILQGHESVLEHVSWTFLLIGVSRAFSHQLVRHRVGFAFSQLSQQYHEENPAGFVEPVHLRLSPRADAAWKKAMETTQESYRVILDSLSELNDKPGLDLQKKEFQRAIRSAARSVLPNATETKLMMTANARALRYFFKLRGGIPGDVEMRRVATELLKIVRLQAPSIFSDFTIEELSDGTPIVKHGH
jgi:thymidylate synthase (FAD)